MANTKISNFDTLTDAKGGVGITFSEVQGVAAYYDNNGTLANVQFSGNDVINAIGTPDLQDVMAEGATYTGTNVVSVATDKSVTITSGNGTLNGLNLFNSGNSTNGITMTYDPNIGPSGQQIISLAPGNGGKISLNAPAGQLQFDSSVSLFSESGSDLELKVNDNNDDLRIYLGTNGPQVGDVLAVKNVDTNTGIMGWETPSSGGISAFTTLTAADVIDWDYATDGPNIKVTLGAGLENVLTVNTVGEFPDGSEGWVILDPSASVDYRLPDEDEGSAATIRSVITNGDVSLGGTNPVLFHYAYDGSTFYWTKFENMVAPANYPPSVDYDASDLLIYITPEAFNQATQGQIAGSAVFGNLIQPSNFGDMRGPISPGSGFEFYPRDNATYGAAYWSMGSGTVGIFRDTDLSLVNALSNNISWQGYIQGPYSGTFETLVDFDGATNTGSYEQHLYISSGRFRVYNPSTFYNYPELDDYSVDGGANLADAWLFVSFGITAGNPGTATLRVACQASLDAAVAAGGATAWNYNGTGASTGLGPLTVNVDANGIYEQVVSDTFTEANIVNILIGVNNVGGEYGNFHYGLFGVYNKDINLADTTQNWIDTRAIYGIT